jgi:hypothetical protein
MAIRREDLLPSGERAHQHHKHRLRQMEVRDDAAQYPTRA